MKVLILAGGMGSRLAEETDLRPKPMVEIGGRPILWHLMNYFRWYGLREFVLALGYRGESIKKYVIDSRMLSGNLTVCPRDGRIVPHKNGNGSDWVVHLVDTGISTQTGGRIRKAGGFLDNQTFMVTYGDGLSNVNIDALLDFHRSHGKLATVTAVRPPARFGQMSIQDGHVVRFSHQPQTQAGWINGGFFVLEPGVLDYLDDSGDGPVFEEEPMRRLVKDGQLVAYRHDSFWQCMDTLRDKQLLENLWASGHAPWRISGDNHESTGDRESWLHRDRVNAHAALSRA
jgi:glucose-1-phosphate cytidylyltransferase